MMELGEYLLVVTIDELSKIYLKMVFNIAWRDQASR